MGRTERAASERGSTQTVDHAAVQDLIEHGGIIEVITVPRRHEGGQEWFIGLVLTGCS